MQNNPVMTDEREDTIDLVELAYVLWNKIWILLLCVLIGASASGLFTKFCITPQYVATATIYVNGKDSISMADLQISQALAADYLVIAKSRQVLEVVIDDLNLDTTYDDLYSIITVTNPSDTHMLDISVQSSDPELAVSISNTTAERVREKIAEITNSDKPTVVNSAVIPKSPVSPNLKKNIAVGGMFGGVAAAAVVLMLYLMDDTFQTEDDVKRYLNLTTLAAMPLVESRLEKKEQR
jgi:capsular polysaccharide biosynthesis protein